MKKNTLTFIIFALVLINLVLNVLIIFSVIPTANKTNNLITKIAAIIDLEMPQEDKAALAVDQMDNINIVDSSGNSKLTISLPSSDGKNHYAVINVTMTLDKTHKDYKTMSETVSNAMTLIVGKIDMVVSSYTYENATDSKNQMQQDILKELRNLFQSDMIYQVSFSSFIVQ